MENGRLSAANALMEQVLEVREGAAAVLEQDKVSSALEQRSTTLATPFCCCCCCCC